MGFTRVETRTNTRAVILGRALSCLVGCVVVGSAAPASAGEILVSGFGSSSISRFDPFTKSFLGNLPGPVSNPQAVTLGPDQNLYVANEGADNVLRYNARTKVFIDEFVTAGSGGLDGPTGLTFGPDGNLYVASFESDRILRYDGTSGAFLGTFVTAASGTLNGPDVGIIFGPDGNLYVPSFFNNRVLKYDGTTGASLGTFIDGGAGVCPQPRTIVFRPDGDVFVSSDSGDKVVRFTSAGALIGTFIAAGAGGLDGASGLIFAEDKLVYVTSWRNDKVLRYSASTGAFVDEFASGLPLDGPTYVFQLPNSVVPTVSEWGMAAMGLLLLTAGSFLLRKPLASRTTPASLA